MTAVGHIPIRTCVVCGRRRPKADLLRMALDPESAVIVLDVRGSIKGRGAYVCAGCRGKLRQSRRIQKAFRNRAKGFADNITDQCSPHAS